MKSLLTQLASIKINLDEDIVIAVLLKSLPTEDYSNVITTLTNLPTTKLVDVEVALLEEERKIKARGGIEHVKEGEILFTKNKFKGRNSYNNYNNYKGSPRAPLASTNGKNCGFCGKNNHTEDKCYLKKKTKAMMIEELEEEGDVSTDEANLVFCF